MTYLVAEEYAVKFEDLLSKVSSIQKLYRVVAFMFKWMRKGTDDSGSIPGSLMKEDIDRAKLFWIKFVQQDESVDLEKFSDQSQNKVFGKYKRLASFMDELEVWRIGIRMREYTPFTLDKKAPAFVPHENRFTLLLMENAHQKKHSGIEETVTQFRLS